MVSSGLHTASKLERAHTEWEVGLSVGVVESRLTCWQVAERGPYWGTVGLHIFRDSDSGLRVKAKEGMMKALRKQ